MDYSIVVHLLAGLFSPALHVAILHEERIKGGYRRAEATKTKEKYK